MEAAHCPRCSATIEASSRFCSECGAPVVLDNVPTRSAPGAASGPPRVGGGASQPVDTQLFAPGEVLAGRFRVVSFLGRGGMGVVYRADDLKLGQAVALKFLPDGVAGDPVRLQRLYQEVSLARKVTHPNVCRVHDVGEVEGRHFISMEYVDGENLASLLRRIGRLPADKAVEIARELCAGLAAAHRGKVLHRDLKPANVMLDNHGTVRITDFGLAVPAEGVTEGEIAGTPAYMAPEQLTRGLATERSDIFSLGLVLYEIFTGRGVFAATTARELLRLYSESSPPPPSSVVPGLDPSIEAVILHCLDRDPDHRPASALGVAAALPGGDPLVVALEAGRTPSPAQVAAAGPVQTMQRGVAIACLVGAIVAATLGAVVWQEVAINRLAPLEAPPAVMEARAVQVVERLGYTEPGADSAFWLSIDRAFVHYLREQERTPENWHRLRAGQPAVVHFNYRSSPQPMVPTGWAGKVGPDNPPLRVPGMSAMTLDTKGRLLALTVVPPALVQGEPGAVEVDWTPLFVEAGLDPELFHPVAPLTTSPVECDQRAAWKGVCPEAPDLEVQIEAGGFLGRPVYFSVLFPWQAAKRTEHDLGTGSGALELVWTLVLLAAMLLTRRNLRAGRGDRRGAMRLATFVLLVTMVRWVLTAHHVLGSGESELLGMGMAGTLLAGAATWLFYLALEPFARRYWPRSLISWSRLLSGRIHDPMVGRDLLLGCLASGALFLLCGSLLRLPAWFGKPVGALWTQYSDAALGGRYAVAQALSLTDRIIPALFIFLILLAFRTGLRRRWAAMAATVVLFALFLDVAGQPLPLAAYMVVLTTTVVLVLDRLGLLALAVLDVSFFWLADFPVTFDPTAWSFWPGLLGPILFVALAAHGLRTALGGESPLRPASATSTARKQGVNAGTA